MKKRIDRHGPEKRTAGRAGDWGQKGVAEWYDHLVGDEGSEYQQKVVIPGVLRLLGLGKSQTRDAKREMEGMRVLDLACGQGVLCRRLAEERCSVVGVDAAGALIEAARRRTAAEGHKVSGIQYVLGDATKLLDEKGRLGGGLEAGSFDTVTLVLAVQNMTPLSPVWQACRAALKSGGVLIVVMMHPCFRVPRQSDWIWEEPGIAREGVQGRVVRQYLSSAKIEIQTHPGLAAAGKDQSETVHFHRPLQAYVNTLGNAGLLIDHVEEWVSHKTSQAGPRKAALDRSRQEIPLFLALRARKVDR